MLQTTAQIVRTALAADPSVSVSERQRLLKLLRDGPPVAATDHAAPEPRLIRRADAARRLGCSLRTVDNWARTGILQKVRLRGRVRAAGFRESDVVALIEGRGSPA